MKAPLALLAAATLFGCSSRGSAPLNGPDGGASGTSGVAGTSGGAGTTGAAEMAGTGGAEDAGVGPGAAGASGPDGGGAPQGLCPSRAGRQLDQPALMGYDGADLVFVREDETVTRVHGPGQRNSVMQRSGWLAAYAADATTSWKAQLYDATGKLRSEGSGEGASISLWHLLPDGTAIFGVTGPGGSAILTPDGRVRRRPFFMEQPDAAGWVAANVPHEASGDHVPAMLNLETGEVRRLSLPVAANAAQVVSGARYLYLAEVAGKPVLVDESPAAVRKVPVPESQFSPDGGLEIETLKLPDGRQTAYLTYSIGDGERLPTWLYDLETGVLASALPQGKIAEQKLAVSYYGDRLAVGAETQPLLGGTQLWTLDLATGNVLDQRAGLSVRKTRTAPGGAPRWLTVNGSGKQVYRYDRATATVEDLHVAGDLSGAGRYALVTRDKRPLAAIDVEAGKVTPIPGGETLPIGLTQANGRWAVGYSEIAGRPYAPGVPLWRVDLQAAKAEPFAAATAPLAPLDSISARPFGFPDSALLPDGRVGVILYDGLGVGLYLGAPGTPWRPLGHLVREAQRFRWAAGSAAVTLSADKACDCYGPLTLPWPTPPAGAPVPLSGSSVQILALDGTEAFAPGVGEQVVGFADATNSCALVRNAAREWFVYDAQARTRRSLGKAESLAWITP